MVRIGGEFYGPIEETDYVLSPVELIGFGEGGEVVMHYGEEGFSGWKVDC